MAAKDLGTKHACFKCGTKFYDLRKPAPICPKCGADQRESPALKPAPSERRARAAARPVEPVAEVEVDLDTGEKPYTYTGGPVVVMRRTPISPFAHALFGGGHASASGIGDSGMVMMFGGGADYETGKRLAFRIGQFDWMVTRFNGFTNKNNARISTGFLFRF